MVGDNTTVCADFSEVLGVGAILPADDKHQIHPFRQFKGSRLVFVRGVAYGVEDA